MRLSDPVRRLFREVGRQGGETRARRLSPARRRAIASAAAQARWMARGGAGGPPASIRLSGPSWDDPVYLEEILGEASWESWGALYRRVWDKPFGRTAAALERVLTHAAIYGAGPLWRGILRSARGSAE